MMGFFHPGDLDAWGWFIVVLWTVGFVLVIAVIGAGITYFVLFLREKLKVDRVETRKNTED